MSENAVPAPLLEPDSMPHTIAGALLRAASSAEARCALAHAGQAARETRMRSAS